MSIKSPLNRQFGTQFDSVFDVVKSNPMYDKSGGKIPSLDLNFAKSKSLRDSRSTKNLINFTRASSGTYVDSDGLIKTSPVNLLTYSEQFDQWTVASNSVITPNAVAAPDGTFTADGVYFSRTGATNISQDVTLTQGQTYTFSVYAKAVTPGSDNEFEPYINSPSPKYPINSFEATSEWVRFSYTFTHTDGTAATPIFILNRIDIYVTNVYFWGAQLEEGTTATDYIPTGATISGAPRFDHDPVTGESLGLLIEEGRTNLIKYSSDLSQFYWSKTRATVTAVQESNPFDYTDVYRVRSTGGLSHELRPNVNNFTANTTSTFSAFATADGTGADAGLVQLRIYGLGHTSAIVNFDLSAGTANAVDGLSGTTINGHTWTISDYGLDPYGNGWYRVWMTAQVSSTGTAGFVCINNINADDVGGVYAYTASETGGFLMAGIQVEVGPFKTSIIPTSGSTVTRSPDIATIEGNKFAKTNLLTYSERFDQSVWVKQASVALTPNSTTAPDGTTTGTLYSLSASTQRAIDRNISSLTDGVTYTFSIYVKAIVNTNLKIRTKNDNSTLLDRQILAADGWQRIQVPFTKNSSRSILGFFDNSGNTGDRFYLWGAQLEEGSELTEYTPSVETFVSRASSATYVDDATGLIKTTPVNLIRHSQDFSNTNWANRRTVDSVTTETLDPLGGSTATKLLDTTDNNTHRIDRILPGGTLSANTTYTLSVFAKQAEYSHVSLTIGENSNASGRVTFDLNAGVKSSESAGYTGFIESSGGGWYRCIATVTLPSAVVNQTALIGLLQDASTISFAGTGTSGVYIWGSQLEEGTTASPYIKTGSTISGAARYENGELLLEPARTNKILRSENLVDSSDHWRSFVGATATLSSVTSPDGVSNMWLVDLSDTPGTSNVGSRVFQGGLAFNNVVNTFSFYARSVSGTGTFPVAYFDGSDYIKSYITLTETTQRYEVSCPSGISTNANNIFGFTRRGLTHNETLTEAYIWGCQVEAAPYASSYIPTTSSTVTRAADVSTSALGVDSWYNQSEGTIFSDISPLDGESDRAYLFSNGSNAQRLGHNTRSTSSYALFISRAGATTLASAVSGMPKPIKACIAYKPGSSRGIIDGQLQILSTITDVPININQVGLGCQNFNTPSGFLNGHITRLAYFPTRLPDDKLKTITTRSNPFRQAITYGITSTGGTFNLRSTGILNYNVDWDSTGGYESSTSNTLSHTYTAGNYNIQVYSNGVYRPYFNDVTADASQITSVVIAPGADLGTNLNRAWFNATNLTSFVCPFDVTSGVTSFIHSWRGTGLTSFPLIDTSSGTTFTYGWFGCANLADFPANMFDTTGTLVSTAFVNAWQNCALTAQSIENILVSLYTNGASNITLGINGGTNAGKTTWSAAAVTAYDNLIVKGWTISFNA